MCEILEVSCVPKHAFEAGCVMFWYAHLNSLAKCHYTCLTSVTYRPLDMQLVRVP